MRNFKVLAILLISILSLNCGKKVDAIVDPELKVYMDRFRDEIGMPDDYVSAGFGTLTQPTIGLCQVDRDKYTITIDPTFWATMNELGKEQLMYHELGHCAMNLGHNSATLTVTDPNGNAVQIPASIMNPYWFGDQWYYATYRDKYKTALRNNALMNPN